MSDVIQVEADPRVLGVRLQEARKARRLTQHDAAAALGVSRPTYIAIEKGDRPPHSGELIRLAELFGRSIHELRRQREPVRGFVPHFRAAASRTPEEIDSSLEQSAHDLERLCDDYLELERICHAPLPRHYPPVYPTQGRGAVEVAEEIAAAERMRLGLGDSPIAHLRELLEADVGLRIFSIPLPSRVAGLFAYSEDLGGCVAIQIKQPAGRRLASLAHEYAHFLVHRYEWEVTVLPADGRLPGRERFANAFAGSFLMPALGLRRRFHNQAAGAVSPATIVTLADLYGVSVEAMAQRLETLRLIPVGTWECLRESGFRVKEAQALLGIAPREDDATLPRRYVSLAVQAFSQGELSEGQLMEFMRVDRERARRIAQSLES